MTILHRLLVLMACYAAAMSAVGNAADPPQPLIVAHRGLLLHAPENTLANFRACLELRLGFEFDVERTKDGQLVCIHDDTVDRTTNGTGKVSELTLAEIKELDAGGWFNPKFAGEKVPTVEEVLKLVAEYRQHDLLIAVDLKAENVGQDVVRLADKQKVLHRLLFIGRTITEPKLRDQIRNASDKAHTATVANNADEFVLALAAPDADWVYFRFLPTEEQVEAVHQAKKRSFIAGPTVAGNVPENWQHAANARMDAILTDYPLELRAAIRGIQPDNLAAQVPVEARLITKRKKYILPKDRHGDVFRKRIEEETDEDDLPAAPAVDLVLELKNVSNEDVMVRPRDAITTPDLEVDGPGVIGPENLTGDSGESSGPGVQPTIAPGSAHRIRIKSLNPGGGTQFTYWCAPGEYTIKATYVVYTGLPPFPFLRDKKPAGKPHRYDVTTPPVKVKVVLEGHEE